MDLRTFRGRSLAGLALAAQALLAACGGGSGGATAPAPDTVTLTEQACTRLADLAIPATAIGLPTGGGNVTAAKMVQPAAGAAAAPGPYCLVSGQLRPVDAQAPAIQFRLALPASWNRKAWMYGGGAFDGVIPDVTASPGNMPADAASPLARGYAVFGSDSGHQASPIDPSALVHREAYLNWAGDALKKTRDAAVLLLRTAYGSEPARAYFSGFSKGGGEALAVAARWPQDWDGVFAMAPGRLFAVQGLGVLRVARSFAAPGAFSSPAKRRVLRQAALAACDALDGLADGVIANVNACNAAFDPATALLNGRPIRCAGGADTGDDCLSDTQLQAFRTADRASLFNFPLANGVTGYPGNFMTIMDTNDASGLGTLPLAHPIAPGMMPIAAVVDAWARVLVARDPAFDMFTLDPANPGIYASRLSELVALDDNQDTDLSAFAARGGKLIILQGLEDMHVSPRMTQWYVQTLQATMGASATDRFLRYFEVAGFGHGTATSFRAAWDYVGALERWVETGADPAAGQTVSDTVGVPGRARPLCRYPGWPQYRGSGDTRLAASFACTEH